MRLPLEFVASKPTCDISELFFPRGPVKGNWRRLDNLHRWIAPQKAPTAGAYLDLERRLSGTNSRTITKLAQRLALYVCLHLVARHS